MNVSKGQRIECVPTAYTNLNDCAALDASAYVVLLHFYGEKVDDMLQDPSSS